MAITESQKRYERKRSKKVKTYAIKYIQSELLESDRLQRYLADTGQSANSYIKGLIQADLDSKGIAYPSADVPEDTDSDTER